MENNNSSNNMQGNSNENAEQQDINDERYERGYNQLNNKVISINNKILTALGHQEMFVSNMRKFLTNESALMRKNILKVAIQLTILLLLFEVVIFITGRTSITGVTPKITVLLILIYIKKRRMF